MRLGARVMRQSPRLQNRGVEEGECSRRTRSMKKKGRASVEFRDSDSDFYSIAEKGKCEVVVDYKKHTRLEVDASIQLCSRFLKIWDFYYDGNNRNFHGKATYLNDYCVPQKIVQKLTAGQPKMYSQILHQALVREIYHRDNGEIWFEFGEKRVRFGCFRLFG
ncbi:hypothetical protein OROHE_024045 [Orobanche hederae]